MKPKRKKSSALASIAPDQQWRVESDLSTLLEAEKIESDPKRMAAVRALAQEKMMAVAKVAAEED